MPPLSAGPAPSRSLLALVLAGLATMLLAAAAPSAAGDDLGIRRAEFWPWSASPAVAAEVAEASPRPRRRARRIWAASSARPLRIALARRSRVRVAGRRRVVRLAGPAPATAPRLVIQRAVLVPKPPRPALVSIYADRTLRSGDAVMMADGIHVFHGAAAWPLRPRDFVRLPLAASLGWHLRQSLNDLDRNPPTRWTSVEVTSG